MLITQLRDTIIVHRQLWPIGLANRHRPGTDSPHGSTRPQPDLADPSFGIDRPAKDRSRQIRAEPASLPAAGSRFENVRSPLRLCSCWAANATWPRLW